jgi:microcystin-dependent protein
MSQPFIGQLMAIGFDYAPKGWVLCNGQTLKISENAALYSLLGTTYGGDGRVTFNLPNLQGHLAVGSGDQDTLGQSAGTDSVTLTNAEVPPHGHMLRAVNASPTAFNPAGNALAAASMYAQNAAADTTMAAGAVSTSGGQPHENRQPYIALMWCIALEGIFPSRS